MGIDADWYRVLRYPICLYHFVWSAYSEACTLKEDIKMNRKSDVIIALVLVLLLIEVVPFTVTKYREYKQNEIKENVKLCDHLCDSFKYIYYGRGFVCEQKAVFDCEDGDCCGLVVKTMSSDNKYVLYRTYPLYSEEEVKDILKMYDALTKYGYRQ